MQISSAVKVCQFYCRLLITQILTLFYVHGVSHTYLYIYLKSTETLVSKTLSYRKWAVIFFTHPFFVGVKLPSRLSTLLKIIKGPLRFFAIDHNANALIVSWINKAKTCLSCESCNFLSMTILVDKNEVVHFQKSPWNALCKHGFLLKNTPIFKANFKTNVSIKHHNSIISVQPIVF